MQRYFDTHQNIELNEAIEYAYEISSRYGTAAAEVACRMYDKIALADGMKLDPAEPAETASMKETARLVTSNRGSPKNIVGGVSRLVKQAAADTTAQNAIRDHAEWAWIPSGDTCPFCLTLASRGWQRASRSQLNGDHAKHIHPHCNCNYCIRFKKTTSVTGYDPEKLRNQYYSTNGTSSKDKINSLRRQSYEQNKDAINEQRRQNYEDRKDLPEIK